MRVLLLSDIQAYSDALERVLAHAQDDWHEAVILGDIVGYGPEPVQVVERVRELPLRAAVAGNHEAMLWQLLAGEPVRAARGVVQALESHARQLEEEHLDFLRSLEEEHVNDAWVAIHGSPRERFSYLLSVTDARRNEAHMKRDIVFIGHTHVPSAYMRAVQGESEAEGESAARGRDQGWQVLPVRSGSRKLEIPAGAKAFVNPGSVGPARDGGEGAAYAIFDEAARTVVWHRGI
jgi:predicted phosphodiesterase